MIDERPRSCPRLSRRALLLSGAVLPLAGLEPAEAATAAIDWAAFLARHDLPGGAARLTTERHSLIEISQQVRRNQRAVGPDYILFDCV